VQNTARGKWRDWSDGFWRKSESSNRCLNMVPNYLCFSRIRIIGYSLNNQHIWTEIQCHVSLAELILTKVSYVQIHELGMKIAVLKTQNNELRNQFDGTCQVTSKWK
jgi:hypothetical protein